ncbi:MAG: DNA-3-methyladenine glycosylase I [Candidatus Diapherotrites archaeon]|uniref:DNA-3-methyladenine glycosylase I n=1 Tax=Candidatus Iainarchaeum sp. TaxID=3101447 RepID=A0A2D6M1W3_9ARCH|nr:DNA-3-methyladenine glycosylase I [Candidatus Diapherotrites archaeon]
MNKQVKKRCGWVPENNRIYLEYHDKEWGAPVHSDRKLFEMLLLEGFQAGLSWLTILKKREKFKKAFSGFDFVKIAKYGKRDVARLMKDEGIIRNRLKIESAIKNARAFLEIRKEFGSFSKYLQGFVEGKPIKNRYKSWKQIPAKTALSDKISKDLKKRGMNFVGSTIIYAFLQSVGVVNDHEVNCFRHSEIN